MEMNYSKPAHQSTLCFIEQLVEEASVYYKPFSRLGMFENGEGLIYL